MFLASDYEDFDQEFEIDQIHECDYEDEDDSFFDEEEESNYKDEADYYDDFANPGGRSALRAATADNPRNLPCPTCQEPNRLTPKDVALGYQCECFYGTTPSSWTTKTKPF